MRNVLLFVLLISCSVSAQTTTERILSQNRAMEAAFRAGKMLDIAAIYSKNAAIVGPRTEVMGKEAVAKYWQGLQGRQIDWRLENVSITEYDEVVIQRGISHLTYTYDKKEVTSVVRFTLVWIQEDGQWKINIDHYSPL